MMKKSAFLLFLVLSSSSSLGLAADFFWFRTFTKDWKKSERPHFLDGRISAAILDSLDAIYKDTPQHYTFFEDNGRLFAQVSCTFHLFEIQGDSLVDKYQDYNRGYTCDSHSFKREGTHYLLGGQGYWSNHVDLLSFDEFNGTWELQLTKNQPKDYFSFFVYQNSMGIVSLLGEVTNKRYGLDVKDTKGYLLDWKSKEWKELEIVIEGLDLKELAARDLIHYVQTQDYAFWASTNGKRNFGWTLIEKETGKIFHFPSMNVDMGIAPFLEIEGNVLTYPAPSNQLKKLDLDEVRKKAKEVGYIRVKEEALFGMNYTWGYLLFFTLVAFGWVVAKKVLPKRNKKIEQDPQIKKREPFELVLAYSGQLLTTEALDQILGIADQTNFDSKRMKRARLINDINEHYLAQTGKELIVREKKAEDKRYVYYKIQA
jgi:hypothetical protein